MSNKREPLSDATRGDTSATASARSSTFVPNRARPAVSPAFNNGRYQGAWEDEQPFDFMLDLRDVEREPTPTQAPPRYEFESTERHAADGQSNIVTKPPPPMPAEANDETDDEVVERPSVPAFHSDRYEPDRFSSEHDWDEVTPRSTSVAATLLSSPEQIVDPGPVSSDTAPVEATTAGATASSVSSVPSTSTPSTDTPSTDTPSTDTPSTEPTGGRNPAAPTAEAPRHASSSPPFPIPAPVPFPMTEPVAFPLPTNFGADGQPPTGSRLSVASSPKVTATPLPKTGESLTPVTRSEPAPTGYQFSPSFHLDAAPITTRGTYKREMEASAREPKRPLVKWVPTVIAAFVLPFIGASLLTSWFASRYTEPSVAGVDRGLAAQVPSPVEAPSAVAPQIAPQPIAPQPDLQPAANPEAMDSVAMGEQALERVEPVILPQSLENAPAPESEPSATTVTPPKPVAARTIARKSRPALDSVDFGAGLTSEAKTDAPSFRVKIPDEQNALEPRNGAHNVPVRE